LCKDVVWTLKWFNRINGAQSKEREEKKVVGLKLNAAKAHVK